MKNLCLLALGGNLDSRVGTPLDTQIAALKCLNRDGIRLVAVSRFFRTPCFPAGAGPDYVNASVAVETGLAPHALLNRLHAIEAAFQRTREQRWGMRTLDIDLIACGDRVVPDAATQTEWRDLPMKTQARAAPEQLILPHPRLQDRAFVLGPLMDIAPGWRHPLTGRSVAEMYADLPESDRNALECL